MKPIDKTASLTVQQTATSTGNTRNQLKKHLSGHLSSELIQVADSLLKIEEKRTWYKLVRDNRFEEDKAKACLVNWSKRIETPPKGFKQVFEVGSPSLATYKKYRAKENVLYLLKVLLKQIGSFFNVSGSLQPQQVDMTAILILEEYYYLTILDFSLCFKNAMLGQYGKIYDRLDGAVILDWLAQYRQQRIEFANQLAIQKHHNDRAAEKRPAVLSECDKEKWQERIYKEVEKGLNNLRGLKEKRIESQGYTGKNKQEMTAAAEEQRFMLENAYPCDYKKSKNAAKKQNHQPAL